MTKYSAKKRLSESTPTFSVLHRRSTYNRYEGLVADLRVTANAWAKTNAFVALVEREIECSGADDALVAAWVSKEDLASILKFGSHSLLVELAFAKRSGMIK